MKRMININVVEHDMSARITGSPSTETVTKIRKVLGLTQCGNPVGRQDHIVGKDGSYYMIRPSEGLDMRIFVGWDGNAKVVDTCYAVFKRKENDRFFTQITPWYGYFGVAQRHMLKRANG